MRSLASPALQRRGLRVTVYEAAKVDGLDHVKSIDENTFGFEDLLGGGDRDFDDYVISFDLV